MLCGLDLKISDFDIFAKRLGLFYKCKEKITSYFGLILTFLYIFITISIFIYYTIQTINHIDLQVNDSTIYSTEIPNINLNNSELLYFAFAVEEPSTASRFVDETIYTVKAIFYDSVKNTNGTFEMKEIRELKVEKCQQEKFGKNYQHLFTHGEFNNSYCISNLDFSLTGGFIYEKFSLIRLDIFPCKNSSENNYHCKPKQIIDNYLAGGYFSILLKDIGLNPSNFSNPVLPTLQDIYTTISKNFFRDLILYYEITEVRTDSGIFLENTNSQKYLKFDRKFESFFLREDSSYNNGESIISIQIRLSDNIHVQKREYKKMHNVFATAGGYMQMLNTIFSLLSLFPNKYFFDNIIVNNLFDFDVNNNRIINKHFRKHIRFNKKKFTYELESPRKEMHINQNLQIIHLKSMNEEKEEEEEYANECKSEKKCRNKKVLKSEKSVNLSVFERMNNASRIEIIPFSKKYSNNNKLIYEEKNIDKNKKKKITNDSRKKDLVVKEDTFIYVHFNLNIFDYLCLGKFREKNKNYDSFKKGTIIFKEKLDVISLFNCIIFLDKKCNCNYNDDYIKNNNHG